MEKETRESLVVTAFADAMRKSPVIAEKIKAYKQKVLILSLEKDMGKGQELANALNSHEDGLSVAEANGLFDFLLPGQEASGEGFTLSETKGITIVILPDFNLQKYGQEEEQFGKFLAGMDKPREVHMNYLIVSPSSDRITLKKNDITEARLDLDNKEDFFEALNKLERFLS